MIGRKILNESGFTLIEVIATIVVVAILGAMIVTFLSASLIKSSDPIIAFQRTSDLNKVITNITSDYNKYPKWRGGTTYAVGNFVVPTIRSGKYYLCTQGGTSNNNEPNWPTPPINDGSVRWTESGTLPDLITLRGNIGPENSDQNNAYGNYHVEKNRFVSFNSSDYEVDDTSGLNKMLKLTIKNDQGGTLTALFISN